MNKFMSSIGLVCLLFGVTNAEIISKNGIAKDSATGLMWQDDNDAKTITKDWNSAKVYCENLTLGGFSDWRLPNIYELNTLLDHTKSKDPYVVDGLENIVYMYYSSSSTHAKNTDYAWVVGFSGGYNDTYNKTGSSCFVRCVRAGQLNFDNLVILKNKGKLKVSQDEIDKISPNAEKIKAKKEAERKKQEAQEQAQREKQAEYDRKHQCDGFYPGKNFKVHTTGLFGGDEEARVTGVDKEGGQVSFEWKRGPGDWKSEETTCSYLKTQMR